MLALNPQYIIDNDKTTQAVVVKINEWENIIKKLEMLDDIQAYDDAKKDVSEAISFDEVVKNIKSN